MDKNKPFSATVPQSEHGKRLDAAMGALFPDMGLRARRRLWEWCRVLLDGREVSPGEYVRAGQRLELVPEATEPESDLWGELRLVASSDKYCAVFKPAGLPSARISGGRNKSAEEYLRENWATFGQGRPPLLCNRLDTETSGLLLLAFGQDNLESFKTMEAAGEVKKHYLALVSGQAPAELYLDRRLNMAGRAKTLVLDEPDPDKSRHTLVRRLEFMQHKDCEASVLDVCIRRGARHQIRAHLASAGLPIIGDALYGGAADTLMYLHHRRIEFEAFAAEEAAPWAFIPRAAGFQSP